MDKNALEMQPIKYYFNQRRAHTKIHTTAEVYHVTIKLRTMNAVVFVMWCIIYRCSLLCYYFSYYNSDKNRKHLHKISTSLPEYSMFRTEPK